MNHCIAKIISIIAGGRDDRRSILQLGYNLGRLSELTGLGREPFWDEWKDAVADWDVTKLQALAQKLHTFTVLPTTPPHPSPESTDPGTDRN